MIDKQVIAYLKLLHGLYNSIVFIMIFYQGLLGFKIRRERKAGKISFSIIKKHRRLGPILTILSPIGFFAGVTIVFLDYGHIFKYPLHFIMGLLIVLSIFTTFLISKRIIGTDDLWRNRHFLLGILIISFYIVQVISGLGILF
jgi:hypothetical protein